MAKEFKLYDKKYGKYMGTAVKSIRNERVVDYAEISSIQQWPYMDRFTEEYSIATIRNAVYESGNDTEVWQKFRVSLKGLSTREKLFCLMDYWQIHVECGPGAYVQLVQYQNHVIRVNNYLGALKRSGHLDNSLRVAKA